MRCTIGMTSVGEDMELISYETKVAKIEGLDAALRAHEVIEAAGRGEAHARDHELEQLEGAVVRLREQVEG